MQHLSGTLLDRKLNAGLTYIPYRGAAPAITDVMGGQVDMIFSAIPPVIQFIKDGHLVPLGLTVPRRSAVLPDVPTMNELVPGGDFDISN